MPFLRHQHIVRNKSNTTDNEFKVMGNKNYLLYMLQRICPAINIYFFREIYFKQIFRFKTNYVKVSTILMKMLYIFRD